MKGIWICPLVVLSLGVQSCRSQSPPPAPPIDAVAPGRVGDLAIASAADSTVVLTWTATGDDGTDGQAAAYDLRRSTQPIDDQNWQAAVRISSLLPPARAGAQETFSVAGIPDGESFFALKVGDEIPNWSSISNIARAVILPDTSAPGGITDLVLEGIGNHVTLRWTAPGDDGLDEGTAFAYDLRYATETITESTWASATSVDGVPTPAVAGTVQSVSPPPLAPGRLYSFAMKSVDERGNWSPLSNVVSDSVETFFQITHSAGGLGVEQASWDVDRGSLVVSANWGVFQLFRVSADGMGFPEQLTMEPAPCSSPAVSPDGSYIAFYSVGRAALCRMINHSGGAIEVLTSNQGHSIASPTWAPDGSRIAYAVTEAMNPRVVSIYTAAATPGAEPSLLVGGSGISTSPAWSPDGSAIAFVTLTNGYLGIWTIPPEGGAATRITSGEFNDYDPSWSPDGSRLAFVSDRTGAPELWTMSAGGQDQIQITYSMNAAVPRWAPDGSAIAFVSRRNGTRDVVIGLVE